MNLPQVKLRKVKRQSVSTASGWKIEKEQIQGKDRVVISITTPGGLLRFKFRMTSDEWKEFKK